MKKVLPTEPPLKSLSPLSSAEPDSFWLFYAFAILLLVYALFAFRPSDEIVIRHHSYKTYYDSALREPDSVAWDLTPEMVSCTSQTRKNAFRTDPLIKGSASPNDYLNSGYDKGHLFSYDDAQCNETDKVECFYMSNMLPQVHSFNAGDWKVLEMQERIFAKTQRLHIVAGGYGSLGKLKAGENIPAYMWKAILIDRKYVVWIMPNQKTSTGHAYSRWLTTIHTFDLDSIGNEIKKQGI
jgi:DNA/RNA endonuclease G (NUC1)